MSIVAADSEEKRLSDSVSSVSSVTIGPLVIGESLAQCLFSMWVQCSHHQHAEHWKIAGPLVVLPQLHKCTSDDRAENA